MENLELQEQIINLGKLFVKELKLEPGVDTFSRWMAHYLAEKITIAEQAQGEKKGIEEKECFDVILKLWQHRHSLPNGKRPLQNFEPIFDLLSKLNPEKEEPFFYRAMRDHELSYLEKDNLDYISIEKWTKIAKEMDNTARVWIEFALGQAARNAKNERTKEWIENAENLPDSADTSIINLLLDNNISFNNGDYDKDDVSKKYAIEKIKKRIEQLQKFSEFNEALLKAYESELEKLLE